MDKINEATGYFNQFRLDEAEALCDGVLKENPNQIMALLIKAKIGTKRQNYGEALNFYQRIIEIEPDQLEAQTGIQLIRHILGISNNFYFENPYTDEELYEHN